MATLPRHIPAASLTDVRWANGGGTTREIIADAGPDGLWPWRLSLALCAMPGPFSKFPGIDRLFMLAAGQIVLTGEMAFPPVITADDPALAFPGETPIFDTPKDGPALALNLMTRRGVAHATMARHTGGALLSPATFLFATAPVRVEIGDEAYDLALHDTLLVGDADIRTDGPCVWARITQGQAG